MKSLFLPEFDATIRYHEMPGDGPAIVYLAALSFPSLLNFLPTALDPAMPCQHSIFVDYLGVGHSDQPADFDHALQNHATTIARILDHENLPGCIIVGHSMGGTVAIYLALQRPDLVSKLIVCEGNITPGGGVATRRNTSVSETEFVDSFFPNLLAKWQQDGRDGDPSADWRYGAWQNVDFACIHKNSAALVTLPADFKQQFFDLTMPRVFVYGANSLPEVTGEITADAPDPVELGQQGIAVAVVPDVGHMMMVLNPAGFAQVLKSEL